MGDQRSYESQSQFDAQNSTNDRFLATCRGLALARRGQLLSLRSTCRTSEEDWFGTFAIECSMTAPGENGRPGSEQLAVGGVKQSDIWCNGSEVGLGEYVDATVSTYIGSRYAVACVAPLDQPGSIVYAA